MPLMPDATRFAFMYLAVSTQTAYPISLGIKDQTFQERFGDLFSKVKRPYSHAAAGPRRLRNQLMNIRNPSRTADSGNPPAEALNTPVNARRTRSRRAIFLTWLRKIHLYVGLWGAALGLMFGVTGILLNHRAIMKIPVKYTAQKTVQIPLLEAAFTSAPELAAWLQTELAFKAVAPPIIKIYPAKKVLWAEHELRQPERWAISLTRPGGGVNVEYFVGNRFVQLDQIDATPMGALVRLHMSVGVSAFWILLADSIAGALILLSITGVLLWTQLHTMRTVAVMSSIGALCAGTWYMWSI